MRTPKTHWASVVQSTLGVCWLCFHLPPASPGSLPSPGFCAANLPGISCGYSWLAAAGLQVEVLGAAVVAVGVAAVEAAGLCKVGGHGWAVKKGTGCTLQGRLVPNLEQRKACQGWYLGEKNIDSLLGRVGGRSCHYLPYCSQIAFSAVHMGAAAGDRASRLQAKLPACLCFTANQGVDTLRTPSDRTSFLSMSTYTHGPSTAGHSTFFSPDLRMPCPTQGRPGCNSCSRLWP